MEVARACVRACVAPRRMEDAHGTLFVSLPSLLDPSLAPPGKAIVHAFTPDWIDAWHVCAVAARSSPNARAGTQVRAPFLGLHTTSRLAAGSQLSSTTP